MFIQTPQFIRAKSSIIGYCVVCAAMILLVAITPLTSVAQTFSSGSTGVDGALNDTTLPAGCTRAQNLITCQIPANGVFNFTTVTLAAGVTLQFTKNARNTPVTLLATGNVTVNGVIDVNGGRAVGIIGAEGGPGGGRGGDGGLGIEADILAGKSGEGPGGGGGGKVAGGYGGSGGFAQNGAGGINSSVSNGGLGGPRYGSRTMIPLLSGSGGGGGAAGGSSPGSGGGGGAGALLIASSGNILFGNTLSGITAIGGNSTRNGGGGSGGGVRLIANTITGTPSLRIDGGRNEIQGSNASYGYARIEAFDYNTFFPTTSNPNYSFARPNPVTLPNAPQLTIASVGGVNAPVAPKGSFAAAPDIVVPTTTANPVTVAMQASNIPISTVVSLTLTQENGDRTTVSSTPLAGSLATSTATATVTLPASGLSVITATASVDGLLAFNNKPVFIDGEQVKRVEIAATLGGQTRVTYITASGKRVQWPTEQTQQ